MYCKLHDSFKHSFEDCNMFCQIVKSAIGKGQLKLIETPRDDQSILIGPDGEQFLYRLLQADPSKHEEVRPVGNGIKLSSKEVVQEHDDNILEGKNSIEVAQKMPNTGGQQKKSKDRCKHNQRKQRPT